MEEYGEQGWRRLPIEQAKKILNFRVITMQHTLENHANTLLIDSDMILTAPLGFVDDTKEIGLSPMVNYFVKCEKYCGGWIFVSNKAFCNWLSHRIVSINSRFADQIALEETDSIFNFFSISPSP